MWLIGKASEVQHDKQGGVSDSYSVYEKPTHNSHFAPVSMERRHSSFGKCDPKSTFQHSVMLYPLFLPSHQELSICNYLIPGQKLVDNEIPTKSPHPPPPPCELFKHRFHKKHFSKLFMLFLHANFSFYSELKCSYMNIHHYKQLAK